MSSAFGVASGLALPSWSELRLALRALTFVRICCGEAVDCESLGETVFKRNSVRTCGQRPVFISWEEREFVLRESFAVSFATLDELRAVPVPACMGVNFAGSTMASLRVVAFTCSVLVAAGATDVVLAGALGGIMTPPSATHALYRFMFHFERR